MKQDISKKDLFIDKIQREFPLKSARVLQAMYARPPLAFRINEHLADKNRLLMKLKREGFRVEHGPLDNSYILRDHPKDKKLSETEYVDKGQIYIQSLSSMVPVQMMEPSPEDKILDMCAAPGSKTSQLALMAENAAEIVAVDNNKKRLFKLKSNLEIQQIENVKIIGASGVGLERRFKEYNEYFDKILIDAPCSNEGLICLSDKDSIEAWNPKASKRLAKLQKKLITSGIKMLKVGGILVYSTCTFNKEENENIVIWLLSKYKNISMMEQRKIIPDGLFTGFFAVKFVKLAEQE